MKKLLFSTLSLIVVLIIYGCTDTNYLPLSGFYQSERTIDNYVIQISIQPDEKNFTEYIDNREVNSGTYDELGDKKYKLIGENQTIEIALEKNNSFEVIFKNLNDGNPIVMKNIDKVPVYYSTEFDDIDKYKALIKD
ncbi:hypothetical protein [Clostridium sp. LP20]|uniref:hypothetical protein n=1 Tax=Clostridium sp. LP20 TaxID=3418665 RepID=UPI003EE5DFDC